MKPKIITSAAMSAITAAIVMGLAVAGQAQAAPAKQHESAKVCGAGDHPLGVWGGYPFGCEAR